MKSTDTRVDEIMEEMEQYLDELDEPKRTLTEDMLQMYWWFAVQLDDLKTKVEEEGAVIETEKGPKENVAINVIHKMSTKKSEYYTKVMRVLGSGAKDKMDELEDFLTRK